jgi:hypothetical protein
METFNKIRVSLLRQTTRNPKLRWRHNRRTNVWTLWMFVKYFMPLRILTTIRLNVEALLRGLPSRLYLCERIARPILFFYIFSFQFFSPTVRIYGRIYNKVVREREREREGKDKKYQIDRITYRSAREIFSSIFSSPFWLLFTCIVTFFHFCRVWILEPLYFASFFISFIWYDLYFWRRKEK